MYRPSFEKIEKASKEGLLNIIEETKNKMTELRDIMEHPKYKCKKCPSELTVYKCDRDILNMAIIRYISLGGEYVYDKQELADTDFNDKLEDIVNISLMNGYWTDYKPHAIVELSGKKPILKVFAGADYVEMDIDFDKESFLYELGELHLGEWSEEYSTEKFGLYCLDGTKWELKIEYKDGTKREFSGWNAYPYNYKELLELLRL